MGLVQMAALPRLGLEWLTADRGLATAGALGAVSDQAQNVAAEIVVVKAHTDGDDLDVMSHKRKDGR